ncbi:MAG TPA: hypothetical protein VFA54_16210 [Bryobacterales bacterium]|jgi:hypothetical protein|nr:hypothetical protein [Bryobacterales bacterium]
MAKWRPAGTRKKPESNRARQIGCIFWLVVAMAFVMWLFYAMIKSS